MRLILPIAVLAFLGLCWVCFAKHAPMIEAELGAASLTELSGLNLSAATVVADGRDILLEGNVATDDLKTRAAAVGAQIPDVKAVNNQLNVLPSLPTGEFALTFERGMTILRGMVPSVETRDSLVARAQELFGADHVTDQMTIAEVQNNSWFDRLLAGVGAFQGADQGLLSTGFSAINNVLTLTGVVPAESARAAVETAMRGAMPDVEIDNQIRVVAAEAQISELLQLENIEFETNSDQLTPYGRQVVERVRAVLARSGDFNIEVGGHTDSVGDNAYNVDLSRRRAATVKSTLSETLPSDNFTSRGYGELNPIADNTTPEGRQKNRRIEFRTLGESN